MQHQMQQKQGLLENNLVINSLSKGESIAYQSQTSPNKTNNQQQLNELYNLLNKLIATPLKTNKNGQYQSLQLNQSTVAKPQAIQAQQTSQLPNALYSLVSKSCCWPDCHLVGLKFDSFDAFFKLHLNIEHKLDDKSHKQLLKQIYLVESIEADLNKQKQILNDMLMHLNNQLEVFKQQQHQQQQFQQSLQLNDLIAFTQLKQNEVQHQHISSKQIHNTNDQQIKSNSISNNILNISAKNKNSVVTPVNGTGVGTIVPNVDLNNSDREKFSKYSNLKRPYEFKTVSHLGDGIYLMFFLNKHFFFNFLKISFFKNFNVIENYINIKT